MILKQRPDGVPELVIEMGKLPVLVRLVRSDGEAKTYTLNPAGKGKLGACLQAVDPAVRKLLRVK